MRIDIITIFPEIFKSPLDSSIIKRAQEKDLVRINLHNLRDFTENRHRKIDDTPYGGGPGMVMKPEHFFEAVLKITTQKNLKSLKGLKRGPKIILLSPKGEPLSQKKVKELSKEKWLILLCGRYEGVDERVAEHLASEEISIGDYILNGGEIPALVLVEAITRLIPGVVGEPLSLKEESFTPLDDKHLTGFSQGFLEYPQYTRPQEYLGMKVPDVLLSGDHQRITKWRREKALEKTLKKRPDLLREEK